MRSTAKDFKSLTEAPPSALISQIGPTGDDYFRRGSRHAEHVDAALSDQATAAMSVSY